MTLQHPGEPTLRRLLRAALPSEEARALLESVQVAPAILSETGDHVSRAVLAQALTLMLFADLLRRVPTARAYVAQRVAESRPVLFDHGALRTVALAGMGDLPAGEAAITRVLVPLGYQLNGLYPLQGLHMMGRAYTHEDFPERLPQFFVSELHLQGFSQGFQEAVARITGGSHDPLNAGAKDSLQKLGAHHRLPLQQAAELLPVMMACFARQHPDPLMSDYELLLAESAEMAWIATEGNAFNHATDRVASLDELVAEQRKLGRLLKDTVEVSRSGRVHQTAFKADAVERTFFDAHGALVRRSVPGSFYEFIQRDALPDSGTGAPGIDLAFDSGNAQGIFRMTAA